LQAQKVNGLSFKAQLDSQKLMAREHKFYPVLGMTYTTTTADVKPTFKAQLDSQKLMARDHKFYPVLGMTYTTTAADVKPTFKVQLDSQKQLLRPQLFIARSDAYYQVTSH
jgi:hypothetical protein